MKTLFKIQVFGRFLLGFFFASVAHGESQNALSMTLPTLQPGSSGSFNTSHMSGPAAGGSGTMKNSYAGIQRFTLSSGTGRFSTLAGAARDGIAVDSFQIFRSFLSVNFLTIATSNTTCPSDGDYTWLFARVRTPDLIAGTDLSGGNVTTGGTMTYTSSTSTFSGSNYFDLQSLTNRTALSYGLAPLSSGCSSASYKVAKTGSTLLSALGTMYFGPNSFIFISSGGNPLVAVGLPKQTLSNGVMTAMSGDVFTGLYTVHVSTTSQTQKLIYAIPDAAGTTFSLKEATDIDDSSAQSNLGTLTCTSLNSPTTGFCSGTLALSGVGGTGNASCHFYAGTGSHILSCLAQNPANPAQGVSILAQTPPTTVLATTFSGVASVASAGNSTSITATVRNLTGRAVATMGVPAAGGNQLSAPFTNPAYTGNSSTGGACGSTLKGYGTCTLSIPYNPSSLGTTLQTFRVAYDNGSSTVNSTAVLIGIAGLSSIAITPAAAANAFPGKTQQFTATATYSDTSTQDISNAVNWTSSSTSAATIASTPSVAGSGLATYGSTGSTTITAGFTGVGTTGTLSSAVRDGLIFATQNAYQGDLGGLNFGDFVCQYEANLNGYSGTWKFLGSTSTVDVKNRVSISQAFYNMRPIASGGPQLVINNSADMWDNSIGSAINYSAAGGAPASTSVWTGSGASGTANANTCTDWTKRLANVNGARGASNATNTGWANGATPACNNSYTLYCMSLQSSAAAPPNPSGLTATPHVGRITLTWDSGGGTTAAYKIAYQTGGSAPADCASGTVIDPYTVGPVAVGYDISGLTNGTTYSFRVCAANSDLTQLSSGVTASATVASSTPAATPLLTVTTTSYTSRFDSMYVADFICQKEAYQASMSGTWKAILSDGSTNAISRISVPRPLYNTRPSGSGGAQVITLGREIWPSQSAAVGYTFTGTSTTTFPFTGTDNSGVSTGSTCTNWTSNSSAVSFTMGATNTSNTQTMNNGTANCSNTRPLFCINTQSSAAAPPDPSGLTGTAGGNGVGLSWTSGGGTTAAFQIAYQSGGTAPADCQSGTVVSAYTVSPGYSYFVGGLTNGTTYSFRVCAANSDLSAFSSGVTATVAATTSVAALPLLVVSDSSYFGNIGSRYVADFACQADANTNSLGGIWKAVVSDSSETAAARISEPAYLVSNRPVGSGGPQVITTGYTAMFRGVLTNVPIYQMNGTSAGNASIWTGTSSSGGVNSPHCTDWTSDSTTATAGWTNSTSGSWLNNGPQSCGTARKVYCVNQQSSAAAPSDPSGLTATATVQAVGLAWSSGGGTTAAYKIAYQSGGTAPADCNSGTTVSPYTIGPAARAYAVTGLTAGTQYSFRVCAANSDLSQFSSGVTASATPTSTVPSTAQTMFVTSNTYTGAFGGPYFADWACQMEANSNSLAGIWKAVVSTTGETAISRLSLSAVTFNNRPAGSGGVQILTDGHHNFWNSLVANPGYLPNGTSASATYTYTGMSTGGGTNSGTCSDWTSASSGLNTMRGQGSQYATNAWYAQSNAAACNSSRAFFCISGQSASAAPSNPTSFSVTASTTTSITLGWASGGGTTAAYKIAYQTGGTAPADCASGTTISEATLGVNPTSKQVTGLTTGTQYSFRICAANSDLSSYSSGVTVSGTTP